MKKYFKNLLFLSAFSGAQLLLGGETPIALKLKDGTQQTLATLTRGQFDFISVNDFAKSLQIRTYFNPQIHKIVLYLSQKEIKLSASNPFIMVNDEIIQFPNEVLVKEEALFVEMNEWIQILNEKCSYFIHYDPDSRLIQFGSLDINVSGIEIEEKTNGTLVNVKTANSFPEGSVALRKGQSPLWVYLDIYGGKMDTVKLAQTPARGIVSKVTGYQFAESAQISFRLKEPIDSQEVQTSAQGIQLTLRTAEKKPKPEKGKEISAVNRELKNEREKWLLDAVVIDAGHGGKDPGAHGPTGFQEKEAALDIALRLQDIFKKKSNVRVVMTREKDVFIELNERTKIANQNQGKLFISIHCNANPSRNATGCEIYFLNPARTERALRVMELENSAIRYEDSQGAYEELSNENVILRQMAQSRFVKESEDLAATIIREVDLLSVVKSRGVDQAGFYVLIGASMPNVLVETAFITNPYEEKLLKTKKFRQSMAESIFNAVSKFKSKMESTVLSEGK